ncbi:MAG: hypothetical protein ACRDD7_06080, partial [Peptostreptococcaceae bacterium]
KMDNKQFLNFISKKLPYRYHERPFETEPTMADIKKGCDILGVPLLEKINLPYLYINKNGEPVSSKECLVIYIPIKKVKQFITKKNAMSVDISQRDMKTGLLTGFDKNGKSSDREIESLAALGLDITMDEFSRPKADSMNAKNQMYNTINITGQVSMKDIKIDKDDSLSKNLMSTYLIGAYLNSNLVNEDYYLPYTLKNKQKQIERK